MTLDLHLHSTVSDGRLSPSELVRYAQGEGVTTMALSDHDSTDGVAEAQRVGSDLGVRVIPAIELSTDLPGASIHILGLFLDDQDSAFQAAIRGFREARLTRAEQMVDALNRLGAPISLRRVFEIAGEGSVGRPHVAQALDHLLGAGQPRFAELPHGVLEPRLLVIEKDAEDVDRGARDVGAELDAGHDAHAELLAGRLGLGHPVGRVVVGQGHGGHALAMRVAHQLGRAEAPVRDGAMQVQVEAQRA